MGLLGLFLSLLPMLAMPFAIAYSDREFETAFGSVSSIVPPEKYGGFFLASAFVIPEYFLGRDADSCRVRRDIVYYQEAGVTLRFDVYLPPRKDDTTPASPMETMAPKEAPDLPGKNAVLVRIHGGAWVTGDKGAGNSAAMNAYFASRGYAVFDIQYGLNSRAHFHLSSPTPSDVMGDFSIDDMVRQIGLFLKYLKLHADEYDADVSCVFLSGGSAGGQLAIAAGLAPEHPEFRGMTEPGLVIRGIIPFYPANGFAKKMGMEGTPRLVDPTALLTRESPPFLLYQGTHDGLVSMANTEAFYQHYQSVVGKKIALIAMPLAGHGSDLYFSGYYNQVFLYYMERFMYLGVTSNFDK
jgi:acetyl esterase/lipase